MIKTGKDIIDIINPNTKNEQAQKLLKLCQEHPDTEVVCYVDMAGDYIRSLPDLPSLLADLIHFIEVETKTCSGGTYRSLLTTEAHEKMKEKYGDKGKIIREFDAICFQTYA